MGDQRTRYERSNKLVVLASKCGNWPNAANLASCQHVVSHQRENEDRQADWNNNRRNKPYAHDVSFAALHQQRASEATLADRQCCGWPALTLIGPAFAFMRALALSA